jgi:hypothetical protein
MSARTAENAIAEHNAECVRLCGDKSACGYKPYPSRDCPDCPKNWMIEWPAYSGAATKPAEAAPPPLYAGNVFLIEGKPHRPCDCSPSINKCARGLPRTLLTTEFSRCMVPV